MTFVNSVPEAVTSAGHAMNYALWPANTTVRLANVPWNNDYRDIVRFTTDNAFAEYVVNNSGPVIKLTKMSLARYGQPIDIPVSFNKANMYNYILVENYPDPSGDSFRFYPYFITGIEYVNPGTTRVYVQLDVWQMYSRYVQFGRGYVERGHIGIANRDQNENNGRDFLTIPEGLDVGGEYMVRGIWEKDLSIPFPGSEAGVTQKCSVMVVSTVSFSRSGGDEDHPIMVSADGSFGINNIPSGADVYFFETSNDFNRFLTHYSTMPWITQGIIAAYMIPPMAWSEVSGQEHNVAEGSNYLAYRYNELHSYPSKKEITLVTGWRQQLINNLPDRYKGLRKLLTYPYTFLELTMHNGMPLVIKPESLPNTPDVPNLIVELYNLITPPSPRVMVVPKQYNSDSNAVGDVQGEWLDFATGITNLPQLAVVNNMYMSYMASNANTIAYQHQSADWSQQRVMAGANTAYSQSTGGIDMNSSLTGISTGAATESTYLANQTAGWRAMSGGAGAVVSGGMRGGGMGAAGAAMGAASAVGGMAIDMNQNNGQLAINNKAARSRRDTTNAQAGLVRDTNLDLASFSSKGDYENAVAGINARVQDAKMLQPTTSGQSGGEAFNFSVMDGYKIHVKAKQIDNNVMTMIGEYWLRYGYAVNRFHHLTQLNVMSKFTYWKIKEMYLSASNCPETFRQAIRGIFEKGVTVWENADDVATLDIGDNVAKTGIEL